MSRSWFYNYENERVRRYGRQSKERSETFISNKYDFQGGDWNQLNNTMIPSLGMTIGQSISALKKSWKMYKGNLSKGEPTDIYSKRILKLQAALGLEQSEYLKSELMSMGYTEEELEETEEEDLESAAEDDINSGLTPAEIQLNQQLRNNGKRSYPLYKYR